MMFKQKGFTLIELMLVVAVVGVLMGIAYPSYQNHVLKTKRSDCKAGLMRTADLQERYYLRNNSYASTQTELFGSAAQQLSQEGVCELVVTSGDANAFVMTANALGTQVVDAVGAVSCKALTLNQAGTKTPTECW